MEAGRFRRSKLDPRQFLQTWYLRPSVIRGVLPDKSRRTETPHSRDFSCRIGRFKRKQATFQPFEIMYLIVPKAALFNAFLKKTGELFLIDIFVTDLFIIRRVLKEELLVVTKKRC